MVAKGTIEAKLKLRSINTTVNVKITVEDGEYNFLNQEDLEIEADITIKYKAHEPMEGNNLFLVYCRKQKEYKLCSAINVEDKLVTMEEGRGNKLRLEVCCPYSVELEKELKEEFNLEGWTKLTSDQAGGYSIGDDT